MSALPASPLWWMAANELHKRLVTVPGILVFHLLPQALFSRLTDDNCLQHISNTAHELAKMSDLHRVNSIQKYLFCFLIQPPSALSTIIHDGAKDAYD